MNRPRLVLALLAAVVVVAAYLWTSRYQVVSCASAAADDRFARFGTPTCVAWDRWTHRLVQVSGR